MSDVSTVYYDDSDCCEADVRDAVQLLDGILAGLLTDVFAATKPLEAAQTLTAEHALAIVARLDALAASSSPAAATVLRRHFSRVVGDDPAPSS